MNTGKTLLVVVIVIVVIAAGFAAYTFMDSDGDGVNNVNDLFPNDSDEWEDIDQDGIGDNRDDFLSLGGSLDSFFNGQDGIRTNGPFEHGLSYRNYPDAGVASDLDRIYATGGSGTISKPYGVYAIDPMTGAILWTFATESKITTELCVVNFGDNTNVNKADIRIIFGCNNGMIYLLKDGFDTSSELAPPTGINEWSYQLDGAVIDKISYYEFKDLIFSQDDMFFATTEKGRLYSFRGNSTNAIYDWSIEVSSDSKLTAPVVSSGGDYIFVGTSNGWLYGYDVITVEKIPGWDGMGIKITDKPITNKIVTTANPDFKIYVVSDAGMIYAISEDTGEYSILWENNNEDYVSNMEITPDGSRIIIGTSSGYVYSLNNLGETIFMFDATLGNLGTICEIAPLYDSKYSRNLYVTVRCQNNTPLDKSDDFSAVYCLSSTSNATMLWRLNIPGVIPATPISCIQNEMVGTKTTLIFNTVVYSSDETVDAGRIYSFGV